MPSKDLIVPEDLYETSLEASDSGGDPPCRDRQSRETCRIGGNNSPAPGIWAVVDEHVSNRLHHPCKHRRTDRPQNYRESRVGDVGRGYFRKTTSGRVNSRRSDIRTEQTLSSPLLGQEGWLRIKKMLRSNL